MATIARSIVDLIGGTPLIELSRFAASRGLRARLLGKLESVNPIGSVKDRIAWGIIDDAERSGHLSPGTLVVDITSGNTGIALAAVAAARGYRAKFYIGDNVSPDKARVIHALGAETVEVPNSLFLDPDALEKLFARAEEENPGAFIANQLGNPANPTVHFRTTGPEIWRDTDGIVDVLVGGVGTGGTISGAGRYLKRRNPAITVAVVEPGEGSLPTEEQPYPHEIDGVHKVTELEPEQLPDNYHADMVDEVLPVEADEAYRTSRALAATEGLLVGISAGAIVTAAARIAAREERAGQTIVAVLPDSGERYLSTELYAD